MLRWRGKGHITHLQHQPAEQHGHEDDDDQVKRHHLRVSIGRGEGASAACVGLPPPALPSLCELGCPLALLEYGVVQKEASDLQSLARAFHLPCALALGLTVGDFAARAKLRLATCCVYESSHVGERGEESWQCGRGY